MCNNNNNKNLYSPDYCLQIFFAEMFSVTKNLLPPRVHTPTRVHCENSPSCLAPKTVNMHVHALCTPTFMSTNLPFFPPLSIFSPTNEAVRQRCLTREMTSPSVGGATILIFQLLFVFSSPFPSHP